jgi:hypothetical protein
MRRVRIALLSGLACLGALGCGSKAPSANAPHAGTSELAWRSLPKEQVQSFGSLPSLRTDDGRLVRLRAITLGATLTPPIAVTEIELGFDELPAGQSAALFSLELPSGAVLNRFAIGGAGRWHDAERTSDKPPVLGSVKPVFGRPGGVSQTFTARVLRQAGQAPRVLIGFASLLPASDVPYGLSLAGLPRIDALDATVRVNDRVYRLTKSNFVPDRHLSISSDAIGRAPDYQALRAGRFAVARLLPETTESTELTFLVDTSLSEPVPLEKISDFLLELGAGLAAEKSPPLVTIVAFDQEVRPIVVRAKTPISQEQLAPLVALGRMGGTDLSHALESLVAQQLPRRHVVMLSDFENTLQPVQRLRNATLDDLARLDSLVADSAREHALKKRYEEPFGFKPYGPHVIVRLDDDPGRVAKLLMQPTPSKTSVLVKGATWSWPPADEYARRQEFTPEIGEAVWVFAEYDAKAPLEVEFNGEPKPAVPPVADAALARLLKQFVGGARMRQYLAGFPYAYTDPAQAAHALSELERLGREHGLISPLSSFVVRDESGGGTRILGGRIVDTANTRMILSTTRVDSPKPKPRPEKCPELVGHRGRDGSDEGCPPLFIDFSETRTRIIADVSFVGGSAAPFVKASPHLDELADLLLLRPELTKVSVRVAKKAQAEGIVRYLVERGVSTERLLAERLLEGELAPRRPSPKCKSPGQQVLVEVRAMSLGHINQRAARKPVQPLANVEPSRLTSLLDSMRASRRSEDPRQRLDDVLASAQAWVSKEPQNPLAYVGLGTVLDARRDEAGAARAYGSLFDIDAPGAGLDLAAAMRFQELDKEGRSWDLAMRAYRKKWEDSKTGLEPKHDVEGSRAIAYSKASRKRGHSPGETSGGAIHEVVDASSIVEQIEAPVFAHVDLLADRGAYFTAEMLLSRNCRFPMQGSVLGAVLSWVDAESELEVDVTAVEAGFTYDSVLTDRTPSATLKWLPLPEDDDAYPIRVSVRAERLGKRGYAFGMLRVLNYVGRGRVSIDQKTFVVTRVGERIPLYQPTILQRPQ